MNLILKTTFILILTTIVAPLGMKGQTTLFNDNWKFHRVDTFAIDEYSLIKQEIIPDNWEDISLPHTPRIEPKIVNDQWQGVCYYAKEFSISNNSQNRKFFIKFEAAMNVAEIWVNGKHLIKHLGGYLPFSVDISDIVRFDKPNIIIAKLDNNDNTITGPKPLYRLDFNTYGGLYRNAWLVEKPKVYITDPILADKPADGGVFIRTKNISKHSATIEVQTNILNESPESQDILIRHHLLDKNKNTIKVIEQDIRVNSSYDATNYQTILLENPILWCPEKPHLYSIKTDVILDGKTIDREENRFGIRNIVIKPEGFWLNGEKRYLRGVNRHQEYPYIGYALSDNAQRRDASKIKMAGFDFVRASHYPVSPAFLEACDELGIFVLEPILGWQYFGDHLFEAHAIKSAREMIRRDRNHPCILSWELSINEIRMPDKFMEDIVKAGHEEYPGSYISGWRKDNNYDIYIEARQHRKEAWLEKPLLVSEYGDWEYYAMNAGFEQDQWQDLKQEERSSRQAYGAGEARLLQQATNIQEAHNDNLSTHAFADGYWVMYDYNRGYVNDLEESGVMNLFRLPKFAHYFFKSQRSHNEGNIFSEPMIHIASYWEPGSSKNVRIFSNCDEVELLVDNKSQGRQKPDANKISQNLKHPPFTFNVQCTKAGKLKAIGYIAGKRRVEQVIATAKEPYKIELSLDESGVPPHSGCNDVLFVYAYIKDQAGNLVRKFEESINFSINGDAAIINDINPCSEAGVASILIKIGKTKGEVKIEANHPQLKTAELKFNVQK